MAQWKPLDEMSILGKHYPRVDGPAKVSGRAKYTHDMAPEACLFACLVSSPHAAATIERFDTKEAESIPGVVMILTDIHRSGNIAYAGEPVAAVAATSPDAAQYAATKVRVRYQKKRAAVDLDAAMEEGAPRVLSGRENIFPPRERGEGNEADVEQAFASSKAVVRAEYRTQVQTHSCLETHGSLVHWGEDDTVTIWDSTQGVHSVRFQIARMLEVPQNKIRVICDYMGGGFGSKLQPGWYTVHAARLSRETKMPVRLMLDRSQESMIAGNRPDSLQKIRIGADDAGKLTAFSAETYCTAGPSPGGNIAHPFVYEIPVWRHRHRQVVTNAGPARAFRAPGHPQACFAMDCAIDELAHELGIDPVEMRLLNDPNPTRQQQWKQGAERIGWKRRSLKPGQTSTPQDPTKKRGFGCAASVWALPGRGTAAQLTVFPDGGVEVRCGTQDIGTGTRTIVAAIVAEELGLRIEDVRPLIGDTEYPVSVGSGGSMTMPSVAPAIKNTAEKAREKLIALAAERLGVEADSVTLADRAAKADGGGRVDWTSLCSLLGSEPQTFHGEWVQGLSSAGVAGCQFAEVEVDTLTGRVRVIKVVAMGDCGLVLDRLTTESQINGGVIQGLSYALYEDRLMDAQSGRQINPGFETYKIAGALETPEIEVILVDEPERGVLGIGEPPSIPTAAAIANAIFNATGVRLRELPMTPDRVLTALEA